MKGAFPFMERRSSQFLEPSLNSQSYTKVHQFTVLSFTQLALRQTQAL